MLKNSMLVLLVGIALLIIVQLVHKEEPANLKLEKLRQEFALKPKPSVDHSKLPELQKKFNTPQEVTESCISCHTERHKEVMNSSHWNWERISYIQGRGITTTGKKNIINNFCIGSQGNEQSCAKCHIGFGMSNDQFDFNNARNVDCMVCHDQSHEYKKGAAMAGYPDRSVNLEKTAQHVGRPEKMNCGSCHFYSGGGNNVKHGDLEESLLTCDREMDVHMAANGMDMSCVDCHTAENHEMLGKLYSVSSNNVNRSTCEQCHTNTPHFSEMLNKHNAKVACQTCHIPAYAKGNATKMEWKWADAGRLKNGESFEIEDTAGNVVYTSIKGSFTWQTNVRPDYTWFNGNANHYLLGDSITGIPVKMNELYGAHDDAESKIYPVKIHRGNQIYDKKYNWLIQPLLYAKEKGDSAYWMDFDWNLAAEAGMKNTGLPYSGDYGFIETEMYWPINHMVAPKEQAIGCAECHTRGNGRLEKLSGFYLPGRDYHKGLDTAGIVLMLISIAGVAVHGISRIVFSIRNKNIEKENIDY